MAEAITLGIKASHMLSSPHPFSERTIGTYSYNNAGILDLTVISTGISTVHLDVSGSISISYSKSDDTDFHLCNT